MSERFERLGFFARRRLAKRRRQRARWQSLSAEIDGSGDIADVIRQIRQRGRDAVKNTRWVLGALILTVVVSLVVYVIAPELARFFDGRRDELESRKASIEVDQSRLDAEREKVREALATALQGASVRIPSGVTGRLSDHIVDGQTVLLYGFDGVITRSANGGASFKPVPSGVAGMLFDHITDGQTVLLHDWDGAITRSTDGGASFAPVPSGVTGWLFDHITDGQTVLLYGEGGAITRSTDGGASFEPVPSGVTGTLSDHIVDGQTVLLYGEGGAITRSTDGGASFEPVPSGVTGTLSDHIVDGQTVLLYGDNGAIVRISNEVSDALRARAFAPGPLGDAALLTFIDTDIPSHLRAVDGLPAVAKARRDAVAIQTKREVLAPALAETSEKIRAFDEVPLSLLDLEERRQSFADFMAICRGQEVVLEDAPLRQGFTAATPDTITLACTQAWQAQTDAAVGSWWQTLARQVPPGILLLFLLATLGGLYRYNLRLVGFHHSRADALEMLTMGRTDKDIEMLVMLSDSLAADKVEFGRANTPADQAMEIVRAVMTRTK